MIDSDLIVLFGSDVANGQPVFMKYLFLAKKRGAKIAVVNPLREPGLDRYWVPSNVESAVFGTRITDEFFAVHTGGDVAFVNGVLKHLLAAGAIDREFVTAHTVGFDDLLAELEEESFDDLERQSGATVADMARFAELYAAAPSAVLVWSMGITQHERGVDNVQAIINLGLARGNVGREGAGLMPIRGHSGVQGGAEMGCYSTVFPGGVPITEETAPRPERRVGLRRTARAGADGGRHGRRRARRHARRALVERRQLPRRAARARIDARNSLERTPLRIHQDILLTHQMLVDPGETVVLLPAATRYEQEGGGTSTTTERRVAFSPELPGPRVGEARSEWRIFADVARRVRPEVASQFGCESGDAIRAEIARVIPSYAGIERLRETGDQVQVGGPRLCEGGNFPTPDGRAHFGVVAPHGVTVPDGRFVLSTRRGKQFNSMVWEDRDPLTGAAPRRAVRGRRRRRDARCRRRRRGARAQRARRAARPGARRADPSRQRAGVLSRGQPAAVADGTRARIGRTRLQRGRRSRPDLMTPDVLLACFADAARAVREAVTRDRRTGLARPHRGPRPVRARPGGRRGRARPCCGSSRCTS